MKEKRQRQEVDKIFKLVEKDIVEIKMSLKCDLLHC